MNYVYIAFLGLLILVLLFVSPILTIWALNTLFPVLAIPTNIWTYLATLWLSLQILASKVSKSKD